MQLMPKKLKPCPQCHKVEEILGKNDSMKVKCDCVESEEFFMKPHVYGFWNKHCNDMEKLKSLT